MVSTRALSALRWGPAVVVGLAAALFFVQTRDPMILIVGTFGVGLGLALGHVLYRARAGRRTCQACGHPDPAGAAFCSACGRRSG